MRAYVYMYYVHCIKWCFILSVTIDATSTKLLANDGVLFTIYMLVYLYTPHVIYIKTHGSESRG